MISKPRCVAGVEAINAPEAANMARIFAVLTCVEDLNMWYEEEQVAFCSAGGKEINTLSSCTDLIEISLGIQLVWFNLIKGAHRQLGQSD